MNYYQHHIGDYRRDTAHLSLLEHGIYRQLLDSYYLDEQPLPLDLNKLMRSHSVRTADEQRALEAVLADFFEKTPDGWRHKRCDLVIKQFYGKSEKARQSAKARWAKCEADANASENHATASTDDANALPPQSEGNATHNPIPNNPLPSIYPVEPLSGLDTSTVPSTCAEATRIDADDDEDDTFLPMVGNAKITFDYGTGRFAGMSTAHEELWRKAYPTVDLRAEINKARAWLMANKDHPKKRIEKFLCNWLARANSPTDNSRLTDRQLKERNIDDALQGNTPIYLSTAHG